MNKLEAFVKARELVAKGWTWGANARREDGVAVRATQDDAVCFCASGAIVRATENASPRPSLGFLFKTFEQINGIQEIVTWNDEPYRTQEEVVAAFDKVIEVLSHE